jgi:hypothetical protein
VYSKTLIAYHSFSDIATEVCSASFDAVSAECISIKQKLEQHPYYSSRSFYEMRGSDPLDSLDPSDSLDPLVVMNAIKEFETWDRVTGSEFETFDDTDVLDAYGRCAAIVSSHPLQITELTKQIKVARKKYLMIRRHKDELADKRPNRPLKTREWLSSVVDICSGRDTDYMSYLEGFLMESVQQVPVLSMNLLNAQQKCREMSQFLSESEGIPFNAKCKACAAQPWKKTFDQYTVELPLLERSVEQMRLELSDYLYEDIPFDVSSYPLYIETAGEMLSQCTEYLLLARQYASENELWIAYDEWSEEYDTVCQQHDTADREWDTLDVLLKRKETELAAATLEKQHVESVLKQMAQKKAAYELYCVERDRRRVDYERNLALLDASWFQLVASYHRAVRSLIYLARQGSLTCSVERDQIRSAIQSCKETAALQKRAAALRAVMDAYPSWVAWKNVVEQVRTEQLMVRELEIRCGNKIGIDVSGIRSVMEVVSYLSEVFDGYREWLYQSHIAPLLVGHVNRVLSVICEDRPLKLEGEWLDKIQTLSWFVRDGSSRPVIEKASGFQRFIVGMACRVAFHQIGFCRIQYDQLFIDEGFTSCDSDNLERVPDFLRSLLQMYDSIYLATHLDELKLCADTQIVIHSASGLSQIQSSVASVASGSVVVASVAKKKGRPPKKVTVVRE